MRGSLMRGRHRGATELVRKSRKGSRTRVATLNVGTLTGRSCELVEALERRRIDFCAVQETRWSCRKSRDIGRGFKAVLCGSPRTTSGVGIIVSERFRDSILSVERFDDRLMKIVVAAKERLHHFFSAYAPQTGCSDQAKDEFWSLLDEKTAEVQSKDVIIVAGDLNGHVGVTKDGYSCHGGFQPRGPVQKIIVEETEAALKKMKPGKATGPYDVAADLWKSKYWYPAEWLSRFFNQVVAEKKVPECWRQSTTIPIWKKKGSPADCSSYRPIRLLSHSMEIFCRRTNS
ncbi:unnamed protein product [Heligmosomoides polygyrus]|uniref:Endo/exonuclease/phosphatase domain-containing protein n=1 Tax=Heligmosomoides polygyrus TaxID=6339 RepID=A0A183F2L7_HELPZ|nr:unnamed protein product [Heligmosomoides polygyrus]